MSARKLQKDAQLLMQHANPYADRYGLVYARVSSKRQELEGHGRESQEERCKGDLKSISVPHEKTFPDTYTGGGDFMDRPAMRAMLAYIDANPHKKYVVIFDDLKRFARDTIFHLKLRSAFKARGVILRCPNYNFDDSPEGMFVETVLAAGNELDRHQNRRQVVQKMKARLDMGFWAFAGKRGYDIIKDSVRGKVHVANVEGKTTLREALESFASAKLQRKIDVARFLYNRGFWKKSKRTPEHFIDEVTAILRDVFHAGYIEYPPWGVARRKGQHSGIISLETFEIIERRLQKEETRTRVRIDVSPEFSLRGLLLCSRCSNKLTGANSKGRSKSYSYYYCIEKSCTLYAKSLPKERVERDFCNLLKSNRLKADMSELLELTFDRVWRQEVQDLKQQQVLSQHRRVELEEKVRGLTDLARRARSDEMRSAYEDQIEQTLKEIKSIAIEAKNDLGVPYRTALGKSADVLKNPIKIWEKVDVAEKHRLFYFLFEKRLAYSKEDGYRTANELSSTRLFESFADQNSDDVDPTGIEPVTSSLQMRRSTK